MALAFSELDLSGISMGAPEPVTPTRDIATDNDVVLESQPSPLVDSSVVLAQLAITPPVPISKTPDQLLMLTAHFSKVVGSLPTSLMCDVYFIYFKNIKNIV